MECLAGLKRAVLWTLALTALSLLVAVFGLLSWAQVPALIGLLYIGVGVVAAPFSFLLGGFSMDSYGLRSRSNDLFCTYMFWCFILFPVTPIVAGCLLCLGVHHVLVYLLPGLCPVMIVAAVMVIDLTDRAQQLWEPKSIVSVDPLGVPLV